MNVRMGTMASREELPAQLPGLDLAEAMERTGIPASILRPILLRFAEKNSDKAAQMFSLLAAGDLQGLTTVVHTLKGASASISAFTLQQACLAVEMAAQQGQDLEEIKALIENLSQALDEVLSSLATLD